MTSRDLAALLDPARFLLLDFDGPVCALFAGRPARQIAAHLCQLLAEQDATPPEQIRAEPDGLEIIRWTATLDRPELCRLVDDALRAAELEAVATAAPTPHADEAIAAAQRTGRRTAIVSNNSPEAIRAYLHRHDLAGHVGPVHGRPYADPARMKPDPALLFAAMDELDAQPEKCVFIGDSPSDIDAARAARVPVIGYANKPGKAATLAKADALITSMAELTAALIDTQP